METLLPAESRAELKEFGNVWIGPFLMSTNMVKRGRGKKDSPSVATKKVEPLPSKQEEPVTSTPNNNTTTISSLTEISPSKVTKKVSTKERRLSVKPNLPIEKFASATLLKEAAPHTSPLQPVLGHLVDFDDKQSAAIPQMMSTINTTVAAREEKETKDEIKSDNESGGLIEAAAVPAATAPTPAATGSTARSSNSSAPPPAFDLFASVKTDQHAKTVATTSSSIFSSTPSSSSTTSSTTPSTKSSTPYVATPPVVAPYIAPATTYNPSMAYTKTTTSGRRNSGGIQTLMPRQQQQQQQQQQQPVAVAMAAVKCLTPAAAAVGVATVDISANGGVDWSEGRAEFRYHLPVSLDRITTVRGPASGGTVVRVVGNRFYLSTDVTCIFGEISVRGERVNETMIECEPTPAATKEEVGRVLLV